MFLRKKLVTYTILNVFDKVLGLITPFLVLFLFDSVDKFNELEYILSISMIIVTFVDLGFRDYILYGYRCFKFGEVEFLKSIEEAYVLLLILYLSLSILSILFLKFILVSSNLKMILCLISLRALFLFVTTYYGIVARLKDRPNNVFVLTICSNILSIFLFLFLYFVNLNFSVQYFFFGPIVVLTYLFAREIKRFKFPTLNSLKILTVAFRYSWPLLVNALIQNIVNNYGKVVAFENLSDSDTFEISFLLRLGTIIQLTHASVSSFYSKKIFISNDRRVAVSVFKFYATSLLIGSIVAVIAYFIFCFYSSFFMDGKIQIKTNPSHSILLLFYLFWSLSAYFELYLNKHNYNYFVPMISISTVSIYFICLNFGVFSLFSIYLAMFSSALMAFIAVFFLVWKKNLFK